jgi:GT2 family glycosyltransferase
MDLSIVIVSFNTKSLTDQCLASIQTNLASSKISYEIIVIDNISTDGTLEMIAKKYPRTVVIANTENVGFGRANNQGIKKAKGKLVFLLNSDTIVQEHSIERLYDYASKHPKEFVGPKLFNMDRTPQTSCGPFFSPGMVFLIMFFRADRLGISRWSPNKTIQVDWVSGAAIMAHKSAFMDDLLFDEKIFMYMEEIDLLYRARIKGYKTTFYHPSHIIHLGGGSSTNRRKGPVLNIYKGFVFFYTKHYSKTALSLLRIMLKAKAAAAWVYGLVTGDAELRDIYAEAYRII